MFGNDLSQRAFSSVVFIGIIAAIRLGFVNCTCGTGRQLSITLAFVSSVKSHHPHPGASRLVVLDLLASRVYLERMGEVCLTLDLRPRHGMQAIPTQSLFLANHSLPFGSPEDPPPLKARDDDALEYIMARRLSCRSFSLGRVRWGCEPTTNHRDGDAMIVSWIAPPRWDVSSRKLQ
jgi:hypothetical protein